MSKSAPLIRHLYQRAGFGLDIQTMAQIEKIPLKKALQQLFEQSEPPPDPLIVLEKPLLDPDKLQAMSKEERRTTAQQLRKQNREAIKQLNLAWLRQMATGKAVLREKMALFWHGHFATQHKSAFMAQLQLQTIRRYALGSFRDLLLAIAQDPAMLLFLNNQQNRKQKPNENFARELMELFTLGRGHYTEQDIREAARAFTGWGVEAEDGETSFVFREKQHDFDSKIFFGQEGNWGGEDILNMILARPETALFIVRKIYRYLVNDTPNETIVKALAEKFYQTDYDITTLLKAIFEAEWFYQPQHFASQIKSPVEVLIGLQNHFGLSFIQEEGQLFVQKVLGQMLLNPPNVAGWPGGKNWIDSSTLLFRLKLPSILFKAEAIEIEAKEDGDVDTKNLGNDKLDKFSCQIAWEDLAAMLEKEKTPAQKQSKLQFYLLGTNTPLPPDYLAVSAGNEDDPLAWLKSTALALCSLPEYQMS